MKMYNIAFWLLFSFPFACTDVAEFSVSPAIANTQPIKKNNPNAANIVFTSVDGGQTWQDISKGLPEDLQGGAAFGAENSFYLPTANGIYHTNRNTTDAYWEQEALSKQYSNLSPGRAGIFAYTNNGYFLQKLNGTGVWLPKYTNFRGKQLYTFFESEGDVVFIGTGSGLFKSTDDGNNWKHVYTGGNILKLAASKNVLLAAGQAGILRSTDNGENWTTVISEGGAGIAVENIKGGFAAISFNTQSKTRRVRTSYDDGKTWQLVDAGFPRPYSFNLVQKALGNDLPEEAFISSIIQVNDYLLCGHPTGILRSSNKGKTWEIMLPSVGKKVFNLFVRGNVVYAVPLNSGC